MTLSLVTLASDSYYERKGRERCTYPGCRRDAQPLHCQCQRHAEDHAERNKKHMRLRRRYERVQLGLFGHGQP